MTKRKPLVVWSLMGVLLATSAIAGTFTSDFSNPNQTGFTLSGGNRPGGAPYPAIENGYLAITYAENSEQGAIVLDNLDPGQTIGSFKISLKTRIGGGSSTPADGVCVYFGSNISPGANFGEEGPDATAGDAVNGIAVSIDTYDNTDGDPTTPGGEGPAIDVIVNRITVAHTPVDVFFPLSDTFVPLNIELKTNGTLYVDFKGQVLYTNLVLVGYKPAPDGFFGVGARTGGLNENNFIDDLSVTTTVAGPSFAPSILEQPASKTVNEYASVSFSVVPGGTPPFDFLWTCDKLTLTDATNAVLTLNNVSASLNGAKFKVRVTNPQGFVDSAEAVLTVNADTVKPTIASVSGNHTFNGVTVVFSEPITVTGATFALSGGLSVSSVTQTNPTTVVLTTSAQTPGTTYTLTVNGVKDLAATPNEIAANSTKDFTAWVLTPGFLRAEYYGGLNTEPGTVADLTGDSRYQAGRPDAVYYATAFNSRTYFPDDSHEHYGAELSGFIIPAETASYNFFLRSDDASELWLDVDGSGNLQKIAQETGCCDPFKEPGAAEETTFSPIQLVAGQRYAVMALMKEGTGGDYVQVAWRKDTDTTPAGQLTPIPGQYLAAYFDPGPATITISQQPLDTMVSENKTVTFTVTATGSPTPLGYQWQRAAPGTSTFVNVSGGNAATYTTPVLKKATDNQAKYRVIVSVPGKSLTSAEATLTVEIDTTPPTLARVVPGPDLRSIILFFSEAMDPAKAGAFANYTVPGLTVTAAKLLDAQRVMVVTSLQEQDKAYTVAVNSQVTDTAIPANPIDPAANSGNFTSPVLVPSAMAWEIWTGLSTAGVDISEMTGDPRYPTDPSLRRMVPGYEGPDFADGYGARLRGFITPKTSGNYVFFCASDDHGELWLSTDDTAFNAVKIAYEPVWANFREWTGNGGGGGRCDVGPCVNVSSPIALEANKRYYTEFLYKEGGGGDHGSVAWKLETAADPNNGDPPIWGDVLSVAVPKASLAAISLPVSAMSPVGSVDTAKPGITARIYQINQDGSVAAATTVSRAEQEFAGILGPNVADLSQAVAGLFPLVGTINWNQDWNGAEIGNFQSTSVPSAPDQPIPGIPGLGNAAHNTDSIAAELITYAQFNQPGAYVMGVNSDDGFKLTATDQPPANNLALHVNAPSTAAGIYHTAESATTVGGAFKPFTAPLTGKLVLADPEDACSALNNAAALAGNIAILRRGVCTFSSKVQQAVNAGAIGAVVVNSRDPGSSDGILPIVMGGSYVDVPAVMISKPDGNKIIDALKAGENITVSLTPDLSPALGQFDGGRGSADTLFTVYVSQAGVYPLRLVWFEGGGGANAEWFIYDAFGNRTLLNEPTSTAPVKLYRARTYTPVEPEISGVQLTGTTLTITFKGVLQQADAVTGTFQDVQGAASPTYSTTTTGAMKFYRARK